MFFVTLYRLALAARATGCPECVSPSNRAANVSEPTMALMALLAVSPRHIGDLMNGNRRAASKA